MRYHIMGSQLPDHVSATDIRVPPRPMSVGGLIDLCRHTPRSSGNPQYPTEDYLELQGDEPVHFSIDREGDERVFVQDYICPETLREMMVIVHEVRAQIARQQRAPTFIPTGSRLLLI